MKKIMIVTLSGVLLLLTGCGNKQVLICTDIDGFEEETVKITYSEEEVIKIESIYSDTEGFDEMDKDDFERICEIWSDEEEYAAYNNIKYSISCSKKGLEEVVTVDYKNATDDEKEEIFGTAIDEYTIDELKEAIEDDSDVICEIK